MRKIDKMLEEDKAGREVLYFWNSFMKAFSKSYEYQMLKKYISTIPEEAELIEEVESFEVKPLRWYVRLIRFFKNLFKQRGTK